MHCSRVLLVFFLVLPWAIEAASAPPAAQQAFDRATALEKEGKSEEAAAAFVQAIEADPDFMAAHEGLAEARSQWKMKVYEQYRADEKKLTSAMKEIDEPIDAKYREWERRFPDSLGVTYAMGMTLWEAESPKAKPYLLKVVERDPGMARAYYMLSIDAERWGDEKGASEYMRKAAEAEPKNASYALSYAHTLDRVAPEKYEAAMRDVIRRFPDSESAASALVGLALDSNSDAKRIALFEELRTRFPPDKVDPSERMKGMLVQANMGRLFESYLRTDPSKAVKFATEMRQGAAEDGQKRWEKSLTLAQTYVDVSNRIAAGEAEQALALMDKLQVSRRSSNALMVERLKARVLAAAGKTQAAYDSLIKQQAKTPDDETHAALQEYGATLGKTTAQVAADVRSQVVAGGKPAPLFELESYTSKEAVSLSRLRGRIVLLSFWFPGCGPCRGEMPHLETVVRQFRSKDLAYLGVNGLRDQDDYVLPFMNGTKYSFTPLKGTEAVTGAEGYAVRGYPTNFLIDREGRIAYSGFMLHDANDERMLQRMIESLL